MNRLLIAGTNSGCGKTTVTCALLAAFKARGQSLTAFKCGPDYIDPMFHRAVSGIEAFNIDPFFLDGNSLRAHLAANAGELSVIEGAMGYYDGIAATDEASAYTVARETKTPVVLVVSARGVGHSLAALLEGFAHHRPDSHIGGVIFNDASPSRYQDLERIAGAAGLRAYGFLPRNEEWELPGRHLGLMTADEISDLQARLTKLRQQAELSLDISGLFALASTAEELHTAPMPKRNHTSGVRLAVARDEAFCFMYEENLQLLKTLGCEPLFFSPIRDRAMPENISGLYLCGGYPELHTVALSKNTSMLKSVQAAVTRGLPTIAECGGFMYLHEAIDGSAPMCAVIRGTAFETERLQRFGYYTLVAGRDNMLCKAGESIRAHEFHYWDSSSPGETFTAQKAGRDTEHRCIHATESLYAGFPHMYFPANPAFAESFVERMTLYEG